MREGDPAGPGDPTIPSVAAICVYPARIRDAREALRDSGVRVASVATGFPSGQTFIDIKLVETRQAVAAGADEIDMVIDRGAFLSGTTAPSSTRSWPSRRRAARPTSR